MIDNLSKLLKMREIAAGEGIPVMREQSFRLLVALVAVKRPVNILEIGTAYGCSGAAMLYYSPSARLTTIEKDERAVRRAAENFAELGFSDRVRIIEGDADDIVPMLSGEYDFIFLDGPKGKYLEYMSFLSELLPSGGVLVADNVLLKDYDEGCERYAKRNRTAHRNMRAFLEKLSTDEYYTQIIEYEDGVAVAVKR